MLAANSDSDLMMMLNGKSPSIIVGAAVTETTGSPSVLFQLPSTKDAL